MENVAILKRQGKIAQANKLGEVLKRGKENLCQDSPDDADEYSISVELGDVIVSATDGLFDNLFNHEIHSIIKAYKNEEYQHRLNKVQAATDTSLPCMLNTREQAKELAERLVMAARAKVD